MFVESLFWMVLLGKLIDLAVWLALMIGLRLLVSCCCLISFRRVLCLLEGMSFISSV